MRSQAVAEARQETLREGARGRRGPKCEDMTQPEEARAPVASGAASLLGCGSFDKICQLPPLGHLLSSWGTGGHKQKGTTLLTTFLPPNVPHIPPHIPHHLPLPGRGS